MKYRHVNNLIGWIVFTIAALTYCLTIEPTASFWDCPEFITTGYKLEVGHPPGAPFFMLTANLFTQFTNDPSKVAMMVNLMSALLSATCILFLFWTITHLAKKLISKQEEPDMWNKILILGAGAVGALAYTWSDTFWFSAVEGEVYAYSSLCTALTFWLILKWENVADKPHSDRWLVLIAYLIGLSVGVHLLNLLCITAIVLVYYFKKSPNPNIKGGIIAFSISGIIIAAVLYGMVPGIVKVGGWFELLFVNKLSLPFNTGLIIYIILLVLSIIWGVTESYRAVNRKAMYGSFITTIALTGIPFYGHKTSGIIIGVIILAALSLYLFGKIDTNKKPSARLLNTVMLCIMMITIGYSSYAVIVIRSIANPPMDQNSPEDVFTLGEYLAREQYGSVPLIYGQTYASQIALRTEGNVCYPMFSNKGKIYGRKEKNNPDEKDSYYVVNDRREYKFDQNMLFPRMHSTSHASEYQNWIGGVKGKTVIYDRCGEKIKLKIPTQIDNIKFFIRYQINYMYWRYFLWNFVGRQNDIQGNGEIEKGNWITGIGVIDKLLVGGDQKLIPDSLKGKGRNVFYGLPLILGLIGLLWQIKRGKEGTQQFWVVFSLFFMTGLAIVLYLNQTPSQPRERDYAYAGSFYSFAIWIGLGVVGIANFLKKKIGDKAAAIVAVIASLLVPIQMVSQTWDDHDRSGRYTCRDFGKNYLITLPTSGNPIIFTNGDNDTFPLWYNHDTEGFRTDTRVCNLSYLQTDWYIDQMKRPAYDSPAVPIIYERIDYESGTHDFVHIKNEYKEELIKSAKGNPQSIREIYNTFELKNILEYWIKKHDVIPTDTIWFKLDKEAILRSGMMIPKEYLGETEKETLAKLPDHMIISLKGRSHILKNELMMLQMIAYCNWDRPLYMATTVASSNHLGLSSNFVLEGLAFRITPFDFEKLGYINASDNDYVIDTEKMYNNLMNFKFGGLNKPGIYLDETIRRMCFTHRRLFAQLADALIKEGKNDMALTILDKIESEFSTETFPHDYRSFSTEIARSYITLNKPEKAYEILLPIAKEQLSIMKWYLSLDDKRFRNNKMLFDDAASALYNFALPLLDLAGIEKESNAQIVEKFNSMYQEYKIREQ